MKDFNDFNCAPPGVRTVAVQDGGRVGRLTIPDAMLASATPKQYTFLALSDTHLTRAVGADDEIDFVRAMRYANESDAAFTCICGDTVDDGLSLSRFAELKAQHAQKPVFAVTGNHDVYIHPNDASQEVVPQLKTHYGHDLYYAFSHGDDVFLMIGEYGWKTNTPFADGALQWLYERLEENRHRRCFVFFHVFNQDEGDSGQPTKQFYNFDIYALSEQNATQKRVFLSLLRHYKNTVWFHGHSHAEFGLQSVNKTTVVSDVCGYRSVHIPSLSKPKVLGENGIGETDESGSQGYVVDVHEDSIVLRGRDFANGCFLPIATYRVDTPLVTVKAKSYTDATGTIAV